MVMVVEKKRATAMLNTAVAGAAHHAARRSAYLLDLRIMPDSLSDEAKMRRTPSRFI